MPPLDFKTNGVCSFEEMVTESLPQSHAFTHELVLPGGAYDNKLDLFYDKLQVSLQSIKYFSMP